MALSGDATDLKTIFDENITTHTGQVTVTDNAYTVAELKSIAGGTSGAITLSSAGVALSGDATDLKTIFDENITTHTGQVTVTDNAYTVAELKSIAGGTSGAITLSSTGVALSGDATDLKTIFDENITTHTGQVTVTDGAYTVAELKSIAGGTSGAITLNSTGVALSGDATDLKTIFDENITTHTGQVTVTDNAYTVAELKSIAAGTSGAITLSSAGVALSGDATDLKTIFDENITTHTGQVTVTDSSYTVAELKSIAGGTSGAITLSSAGVALSGECY